MLTATTSSRPSSAGRRGSLNNNNFNSPHNEGSLKPNLDTCYFSRIDENQTGFAEYDEISDYINSLGCSGSGTLTSLGMHSPTSIDLKHLTSLLEAEIDAFLQPDLAHDEVLRSGIRAAQAEVNYLKSGLDNAVGERDKFKNDLAEVNQRSVILTHEIDEQHSRLEKAADMRVKSLEQKYQAQMRELTSKVALEKEQHLTLTLDMEAKKRLLNQQMEEKEAEMRKKLENITSVC